MIKLALLFKEGIRINIYDDIGLVKGVGPKLKERLNKVGIFTVLDLLLYFPRDYEFLNDDISLNGDISDEKAILKCKVQSYGSSIRTRNGKTLTTINFTYNNLKVIGKWFNQPYIKRNFILGNEYNLMGKFKKVNNTLEVINPLIPCKEANKSEILPIYTLKNGLTNKILVKLINEILKNMIIKENLPEEIVKKYKLISLDKAIRSIHFPEGRGELQSAINRLKFQELFTYSLKIIMMKAHIKKENSGISFKMSPLLKDLKESLPYTLTNAQSRTLREILLDQKRNIAMNRLVQGDVGSGKTLVALISMFNVYMNGYQTVLMAPTEILANQHYAEAKKYLEQFGVDIELLTGSTKEKEKKRIKEKIASGKEIMLIGTHAVIQDDVELNNLGLVVTDEQHRFGVEQRSRLINKNKRADVLVMTATPIPRTLSLYLYSDLDISIIDELPPGRKPIDTMLVDMNQRMKAYNFALKEVGKGRQFYIVSPLIEENEKLNLNSVEKIYEELKNGIFKDVRIEILHGKMSGKDKDKIINTFKNGEIKGIISTTVIEVGVNVPNSTMMIIENAERFGLAQLHQLRGRVGRGEHKSYCILIANTKNDITRRRMEIMTESSDGFYIAEEDLKLRGAGEVFGMRQHGDEGFILANVVDDINILKCANHEAKLIVNNINEDNKKLCTEIMRGIERNSRYICFN
ncbi:ATP-dependent DNA helicase RecG [Clostridium perfringens]|jgi:ATP-dependent DNA helicase RecG|uniref:ATP-dependent DNA helicase RecG n=1 Tax=Clostridium perfringens TaxID=1502 RepID=A0AAE8FU16_CLOPF|nr:ATP-dependent DNA helicase RecG [Clostridium perfringens]EIF6289002.1 ATP-dependent DNA helicase RecG [Clostridium perfringens]EJT5929917.1 ATP-dependent DNA helicase RecG [Clostridium perfringens]EJT6161181.1 ATP-dependent DNA helicase RecG [Clostridium perfringens]EJT6503662.1 ATP-dependent DNA helicase RecG [Clostridium perfringens]MCC5431989.1 ATP-dependent DNA helicase RecG [Clostridium perfringens]